jgi:hypothetical protein
MAAKAKERFFDDLSTSQRQLLAIRELKKGMKDTQDDIMSHLCKLINTLHL